MNWVDILAIVISILAVIITIIPTYWSWHRKRIRTWATKTRDQMIKAVKLYSILVPKSKNDKNSSSNFYNWDNVSDDWRNQGIIYLSVKPFVTNFNSNWQKLNDIATKNLREELLALELKQIKQVYDFWFSVNKKLNLISKKIEQLELLETETYNKQIYTKINKDQITIDNFYPSLLPSQDTLGYWTSKDNSSNPINDQKFNTHDFDKWNNTNEKNLLHVLKSNEWRLNIKFKVDNGQPIQYNIFALHCQNEMIEKIETYFDSQIAGICGFLNQNNSCSCSINQNTLNKEDELKINDIAKYMSFLKQLLKVNDVDQFLKLCNFSQESNCLIYQKLKEQIK